MAKKETTSKGVKAESKCDPVRELAKDILCALIASNENEDGRDTIKKAYDLARAFEDYET
jgi:hypothetical protein